MKESYLCVSRAANLKTDLLELYIIGENATGWGIEGNVLIVAMKSFQVLWDVIPVIYRVQ